MEVIRPSETYFEEYYRACRESYDNNITEWMPFDPDNYEEWKKNILRVYENYEKGVDIPEGMPVTCTYWFVEGKTLIGEIQIRPFLSEQEALAWGHIAYAVRYSKWNMGYGTKLLKAAIEKLREFCVPQIFIACHSKNAASIRVIEKNGGIYMKKMTDEEGIVQNIYKMP